MKLNIYKFTIQLFSIFFLFGSFLNCTSQEKKKSSKKITLISAPKKVILEFPDYLDKNYILGKFDYTKHADFIKIPKDLSSNTIYLRRDVFDMFHKMATAAKRENITLTVISGTRNFAHQKRIWNYKWTDKYKKYLPLERAKKILEYSSMPSTSRHHWGTDIDINNLNDAYFLKGKGKKEYIWLTTNANKFGFYQVYTSKKDGRTGYNEEKWHWSFAPISSIYLKYYNQNITHKDIKNFKGSEFAKEIDMIKNYVNGINPTILKYKP